MADVEREAWGSIARIAREQPDLVARTLDLVAEQGPIRARDTGAVRPPPRAGHMWNWHEGKVALEYLFFTGQVAAARRVNFERLYDMVDRVLPAEIRRAADAERRPTRSASWCGVAAAGARCGHRARPRRLLPAAARRLQGAGRGAGRERRADPGRGRGLDRSGLPVARRPPAAPAVTPARCCRRSTR